MGMGMMSRKAYVLQMALRAIALMFLSPGLAQESLFFGFGRNLANVVKPSGLMSREWGLESIMAPEAWVRMQKKCATSGVVVAVIDTGVNFSHPALQNSIWTNKKEAEGQAGVDDDTNGFNDDLHGWDFATNSPIIVDQHGHGTHIAGIISANGSGDNDLKGVCPGTLIMSLRYYNPKATGLENLRNTRKAIEYAVDKHVDIINYSGGGAEYAEEEFEALKKAEAQGILVVAAAGNEQSNADKKHYYPAAYDLNNIISVTAIDEGGSVLPSSNWGIQKVHVAAPGNNILSTENSGGYTFMTGTSQATAFVSGVAAMLLAEKPSLKMKAVELKKIIEDTSKPYPQLVGKTKTGGRVNALAAIESIQMKVVKPPLVHNIQLVHHIQAPKKSRSVAAHSKSKIHLKKKVLKKLNHSKTKK